LSSLDIKDTEDLAAIEYHGIAGCSTDCRRSIAQLLHFEGTVKKVLILTDVKENVRNHGMLLQSNIGDEIAVKSGFTSGYLGRGPGDFSAILGLLVFLDCEIEEILVEDSFLERLDASALTLTDIEHIRSLPPLRPKRLNDYIFEKDYPSGSLRNPWKDGPYTLPFAIVDDRLIEFAKQFDEDPDRAISKGFRRLENAVRKRLNLGNDSAAQEVFGHAFGVKNGKLCWAGISDNEQKGRLNLFLGAYAAHRNPRAHSERNERFDDQLSEFLLLNHLFKLESEAISR